MNERDSLMHTEPMLAAMVWCRLGAGIHGDRKWHHPVSMYGQDVGRAAFAAAKAQGYLAQDNVWRTTELGDRALREAGLLA
jgi:hypothetical protein